MSACFGNGDVAFVSSLQRRLASFVGVTAHLHDTFSPSALQRRTRCVNTHLDSPTNTWILCSRSWFDERRLEAEVALKRVT